MWNSLEHLSEHLPTVAVTATAGAIIAGYRGLNACCRSRRRPKISRAIAYSANSSLSGAFGAALIAAGMVHLTPTWPWLVIFLGVTGGITADVARANGLQRLKSVWLDYLALVRELSSGRDSSSRRP